eukprot:scaffold63772_cov44-Prasinocladus_malaysianus.AAC.2
MMQCATRVIAIRPEQMSRADERVRVALALRLIIHHEPSQNHSQPWITNDEDATKVTKEQCKSEQYTSWLRFLNVTCTA